MGLFKIINKVIKVSYRLDLLLKIKIHLVYYIVILKPVYSKTAFYCYLGIPFLYSIPVNSQEQLILL